jgi:hypothetical protein
VTTFQQLILAAIGSGLAGSFVTAFVNRRKVSADATRIITDAAAQVVKNLTDEAAGLRRRVERLEQQHRSDRKAQTLHAAWDYMAIRQLREQGIDLEEPPPLYAPDIPAWEAP